MSLLALLAATGSSQKTYVEDVFSTHTYTGNGSTQTITNGINLSTYGGLVWIKNRDSAISHCLFDTARGVKKSLVSNTNAAEVTAPGSTDDLYSFTSGGFSVGSNFGANVNSNTTKYVSWTFRKVTKFFDVVTYTGTGSNTTVAHSLGSVPGMIWVKRTDTTGDWQVYHKDLANTEFLLLDSTAAKATGATKWNSTTATASVFSVGTHADVNASGGTYVAYLFAHDTSTDGLIRCGSFTTDGSGNADVTLNFEPQYVLAKKSSATSSWRIVDSMRGNPVYTAGSSNQEQLLADLTNAGGMSTGTAHPTSTGFVMRGQTASETWVYMAIRRGPMRQPTSGSQVFNAIARTANNAANTISGVGFPPDLVIPHSRGGFGAAIFHDRLRGATKYLDSSATAAEATASAFTSLLQDGYTLAADGVGYWNFSGTFIDWCFRRYPGVFEQVCYTGTGVAKTEAHNLGAVPEMIIVKSRSGTGNWATYHSAVGSNGYLIINGTNAAITPDSTAWNNTSPTATQFSIGTYTSVNTNATTYVAYLFATLAGISKVFSYTGNGTTQTIDCGFAAGARFVMIKRVDSTGDWYVWNSTTGIVAGNDPHLSLNTTAAEVITDDSLDPDSTGFIVNQLAATNINVTSATYIGIAFS